jgi:hypothetical protein
MFISERRDQPHPISAPYRAYGNVDYGKSQTGTESGNAETAKPLPKVARAVLLSRPLACMSLSDQSCPSMKGIRKLCANSDPAHTQQSA